MGASACKSRSGSREAGGSETAGSGPPPTRESGDLGENPGVAVVASHFSIVNRLKIDFYTKVNLFHANREARRVMYGFNGNGPSKVAETPSFRARAMLERFGLRATRQRLGLAKLLFGKGDRHITADALASEAQAARMPASLATVYNVLNLFAEVGLVRSLPIEGGKTVFDTNTSNHSHFYFEDTGAVTDIALDGMRFADGLSAPEGYEVAKIDVVVRLRLKDAAPAPHERFGRPLADPSQAPGDVVRAAPTT
jgi:Fur family iron response transcriptional regulator